MSRIARPGNLALPGRRAFLAGIGGWGGSQLLGGVAPQPVRGAPDERKAELQEIYLNLIAAGAKADGLTGTIRLSYGSHFVAPTLIDRRIVTLSEQAVSYHFNEEQVLDLIRKTTRLDGNPYASQARTLKSTKPMLGVGGQQSAEVRREVQVRSRSEHPVFFKLGAFGIGSFSSEETDISLLVSLFDLLTAYAWIRLGIHGGVQLFQKVRRRLWQAGAAVQKHTISRRRFILQEVGGTAAAAAMLWGLNYAALYTDMLGRYDIPVAVASAFQNLEYTLPEDLLRAISAKEYHLFEAVCTLRNLNFTVNSYQCLVALSHSVVFADLQPTTTETVFGLLHMGMKPEFLSGYAAVARKLADKAKEIIRDFVNMLAATRNDEEQQLLFKSWLYVAGKLSSPVSNYNLHLPPEVPLPQNGITILWQAIAQVSSELQQVRGDEPGTLHDRIDAFGKMVSCLAHMHAEVQKELREGLAFPEDHRGYNGIHTLVWERPFSFLLPSWQAQASDYVIALQNGNTYFLRRERSAAGEPATIGNVAAVERDQTVVWKIKVSPEARVIPLV